MTIGTLFMGTGCIVHPHGWSKGCGTCDLVMANVAAYYRKRESREVARHERMLQEEDARLRVAS